MHVRRAWGFVTALIGPEVVTAWPQSDATPALTYVPGSFVKLEQMIGDCDLQGKPSRSSPVSNGHARAVQPEDHSSPYAGQIQHAR
jgi:hypothetical protein